MSDEKLASWSSCALTRDRTAETSFITWVLCLTPANHVAPPTEIHLAYQNHVSVREASRQRTVWQAQVER
jgi:hypothetical protein